MSYLGKLKELPGNVFEDNTDKITTPQLCVLGADSAAPLPRKVLATFLAFERTFAAKLVHGCIDADRNASTKRTEK